MAINVQSLLSYHPSVEKVADLIEVCRRNQARPPNDTFTASYWAEQMRRLEAYCAEKREG